MDHTLLYLALGYPSCMLAIIISPGFINELSQHCTDKYLSYRFKTNIITIRFILTKLCKTFLKHFF